MSDSLNPGLLRTYIRLRREQEEINIQLKSIAEAIVTNFDEIGKTKQPTSDGIFSISTRKNWKYSPAIDEALMVVDDMKGKEQQRGIATYSETRFLQFRSPKDDPNEKV